MFKMLLLQLDELKRVGSAALLDLGFAQELLVLFLPGGRRRKANIVGTDKSTFIGHVVSRASVWVGMPAAHGLARGIAWI